MNPRYLLLLLATVLCWPIHTRADIASGLALDSHWLALGHYRSSRVQPRNYYSFIEDQKFFLSPQGHVDPLAELMATMAAVDDEVPADANLHPVCRFPARYRWLNEQLLDPVFTAAYVEHQKGCEDYREWRNNIKADSAALIYASTHLNSPSSMYGHTLLRIDPPGFDNNNSALLSWGVSFGANIPPDDNSILYAYKGIFGGYPGLFNVMPYYEKLKEYSRIENRDVWEYELNLTSAEVDTLVTHLWELKEINFKYFFFDENCSYRLLELLDLARPGQGVMEGYPLVAIPVDTVRGVIASGFVKKANYRPSISTKLETKISTLTSAERDMAVDVSEDPGLLASETYLSLVPDERARVSHVAYDFLRYRVRKSPRDETVAKNSYRLLQEINALPIITFPEPDRPVQPELGHDSGSFTLSGGREASQDYLDMEVRLSFHELEDNIEGYMPGSAINMGRFKFRQYDPENENDAHDMSDNFQLQQLDVIDIDSLSPRNDFFQPISWRSSVGFERYRTEERDQGVMQVNGGGGLTYEPFNNTLFYLLGTARAEYNESFDHNWQAATGLASGWLYVSPATSWHLGFDGYEFFNGYERARFFATAHFRLAKNSAIELSASHHHYSDIEFDKVELAWRQHF